MLPLVQKPMIDITTSHPQPSTTANMAFKTNTILIHVFEIATVAFSYIQTIEEKYAKWQGTLIQLQIHFPSSLVYFAITS